MTEWTSEQEEALKLLENFIEDSSDEGYSKPFVICGAAGTGKTYLISEYLKSTTLKYLVNTLSGKASNVLMRRGIPSETIHHCLYLPTELSLWKKFSNKINYAINECNGIVEKNPEWNEKDPNTEYRLRFTGDKEKLFYIRKDSKGNEVEEEVYGEDEVPDGYEMQSRLEENVEQIIRGRKEIFRTWDTDSVKDIKEFLDYENIIGFEDLRDESEGGSWLFKLRADRLYHVDVLVIDEYGMVPGDMMTQLLSVCKEMKVKLILSGDPNQLSPISKVNVPLKFEPDITLTQVMRQSVDNPILHFATLIRLYGVNIAIKQMYEHQSDKFAIVTEDSVSNDFLRQYKGMNTQVICGLNKTREWLNKRIKGNTKLEVGDKIIVTEINDWDFHIDKAQYLTNGTQGIIKSLELPEDHFYPEYRPRMDDAGEIDFENPKLVEQPSSRDIKNDFRLGNYICTVDFESSEGDHSYDNRNMKTVPLAISRSSDDEAYYDREYLPRSSSYGFSESGKPRKVSAKSKLIYQYDYIVEHFEGSNRKYNQVPKHMKYKLVKKYYLKCYDDYYSCPDFRKKRKTEKLDNDEEKVIYNTERTKPYYLSSHIADHGYAITTHKSQGSEYDDVMVWFEPFGSNKDIKEQLYTAVTRAKTSLVLVLTHKAEDYLGLTLQDASYDEDEED